MASLFLEVFPTLELKEELKTVFSKVKVLKIVSSKNHDRLKINIESCSLIPKADIYQVEEAIGKQLFSAWEEGRVVIEESYDLSTLYNAKNLTDLYYKSMLVELKHEDVFLYNMMKSAQIDCSDDRLVTITVNDDVVSRSRAKELEAYLSKVYNDRCHLNVDFEVLYMDKLRNSHMEENEIRIENKLKEITKQNAAARGEVILSANEEQNKTANEEQRKTAKEDKKTDDSKKAGKTQEKNKQSQSRSFAPKNPDVIYGRDFEGDAIELQEIVSEMGEVIIRGQIMDVEVREIKNEKSIIIMSLTDFTDSIKAKVFTKNEQLPKVLGRLSGGSFIKMKGIAAYDMYDREVSMSSINGIKEIPSFKTSRMDTAPVKRVELHCHTKMSDMDGITDVKDIVKCAMKWGHKAIAITDHGVVQAFPDANHTKKDDFKVIYGVEGYLVDDMQNIAENEKGQSLDDTFVVFDLETTGLSAKNDRIIEIGAVKVTGGRIVGSFSEFVNPERPIPAEIEQLTGITDGMVIGAMTIEDIMPKFMEFIDGAVLVAHNAAFDVGFITENLKRLGQTYDFTVIDTIALARILCPGLSKFKLDTVAKHLGIKLDNHHRAVDDAKCTADIFVRFVEMLKDQGILKLSDLNKEGTMTKEAVKKLHSYHIIILAQNDVGRVNLYRLVSMSHIDYFYKRPNIPRSLLSKYREGLIIGSACEAGELFQALVEEKPSEEIAQIVKFYDYLEIQPIGNNRFMINDPRYAASSEEDLRDYNRKIVELGETFNKPVVATCDVHFLNPEDEVYRRIIMKGMGFSDADEQAPLYLHTTDEMLEEFQYLGSDKAREVVIENSNLIADMIENISPVRPDKCPPVIENSDTELRTICYNKAHEMYGENLPPVVTERLERELNSIISNGFAVMYIIAQKLVWKSNEDGYLVGSRGSVGSSFVATMSGITEVNPLSPHYYCKKCHFSDFDSELVMKYQGMAGCDMPDRECPVCGEKLAKDGFDIPFETFLGFKGDKEPDIDLNFSGDYQSVAHKYTEVIFGEGHTFRAGTIGTVAEQTAAGFVRKYFEEKGIPKRNCEISRLAQGCIGIRRTTGQHPGGIVVLPHGEEIYSFTPVQRPANDMTTDIITTHFDYHSIDHNLLKLDILGHDDPTMIRMLENLTGINAREIPLDDKKVMALFDSTEVLGIKPEDIGGCKLGCLGIPEFGTDFVIQMVLDTKPKCFSDLIRISGLSHGTDVWLGNAQTVIAEGKATISTAICTRDDIMTYLISKGVESEMSFKIMENVRKGKVASGACDKWPGWKEEMIKNNVPDWYIESCEKIKYMFPKAHAAAYVMMAWRIAYCKIYYPLAYYCAFFTIRASGFSYKLMCQGKERLNYNIKELKNKGDGISKAEEVTLKDMRIVQEMYARGFEFAKIDLYKVDAKKFQIIDGKLMPSLSSIDGLGEKVAESIVEAAKQARFLSKDDLKTRGKASSSVIETLSELGIIDDLPESNQLSLFDFQ